MFLYWAEKSKELSFQNDKQNKVRHEYNLLTWHRCCDCIKKSFKSLQQHKNSWKVNKRYGLRTI